jgi:hypothetical protein
MRRRPLACAAVVALLATPAVASEAAGTGRAVHRVSWQRSYVSPKRPTVIKVAYESSPSYHLDHASVYFHPDRVAVTVWVHGPKRGQVETSSVVRCAAVRMGEPLHGRKRIDGRTHRHPSQRGQDPLMRTFALRRAACPHPAVVRHHFE